MAGSIYRNDEASSLGRQYECGSLIYEGQGTMWTGEDGVLRYEASDWYCDGYTYSSNGFGHGGMVPQLEYPSPSVHCGIPVTVGNVTHGVVWDGELPSPPPPPVVPGTVKPSVSVPVQKPASSWTDWICWDWVDKGLGVVQGGEFMAGVGDTVSLGITTWARNQMWDEEFADIENPYVYGAGVAATTVTEVAFGVGAIKKGLAKGGQKAIGALKAGTSQADEIAENVTVLGHNPAYMELAEKLGARKFNIPDNIWTKMTNEEI